MAGWNEGGGFEAEIGEAPPPVTETPTPEARIEAPSADSLPEAVAQPVVETTSSDTQAFSEAPEPEPIPLEPPNPQTEVAAVEPAPLDVNDRRINNDVAPLEASNPEPTDLPPVDTLDVATPNTDTQIEPEDLEPTNTKLTDAQLADMASMDHDKFAQVLTEKPGSRDAPETYLTPEYVDQHLAQFDVAHRLQGGNIMLNGIGNPVDQKAFVTPDEVSEDQLTLRPDDNRVHMTMSHLENVGVEMPTGNEKSANNPDWRPGGHDQKGQPEGVVDMSDRPFNRMVRARPAGRFIRELQDNED